MPASKPHPVAEDNPVEVPLYTTLDAARYLRVPLWGVLMLTGRFRDWPRPEGFFHYFPWGPVAPPVPDDVLDSPHHRDEQPRLTFRLFAALFVRTAALQTLVGSLRVGERSRDRWESLHHGIWRGLEDSWHAPDLFDGDSVEVWLERAAAPFAQRLAGDDLALLRKWLALRLERVVLDAGRPVRIYTFSRDPAENSPRVIVLDPRIRFGRPTISGRGLPTDILFERHQAGDSIADLAEDYDVTIAEAEEAIRHDAARPLPLCPFCCW